jgi:hypothetical protein
MTVRYSAQIAEALYWLDRAHIAEFKARTKPGNKFSKLMAEARAYRETSRRIAAQAHNKVERAA